MSYLVCPHCGEHTEVFGSGGGDAVATALTRITGTSVSLLGEIPIDTRLRQGGDEGMPLVLSTPDAPAAQELRKVADGLSTRARGLAGRSLSISPR
jgi:ATP-binding protein involved in chromosome partitioning